MKDGKPTIKPAGHESKSVPPAIEKFSPPPGDYCIFKSVQDAHIFFHGRGFNEDDFNRFLTQISTIRDIEKQEREVPGVASPGVERSIQLLADYTQLNAMRINRIFLHSQTYANLDFEHVSPDLPYSNLPEDNTFYAPYFILTLRENGPGTHVFFVGNDVDYRFMRAIHMNENDSILAILSVEKSEGVRNNS